MEKPRNKHFRVNITTIMFQTNLYSNAIDVSDQVGGIADFERSVNWGYRNQFHLVRGLSDPTPRRELTRPTPSRDSCLESCKHNWRFAETTAHSAEFPLAKVRKAVLCLPASRRRNMQPGHATGNRHGVRFCGLPAGFPAATCCSPARFLQLPRQCV